MNLCYNLSASIFCLHDLSISDKGGRDTKISQCRTCTYLCSGCPLGFFRDNACNLLNLLGDSNQQGNSVGSDVFANKRFDQRYTAELQVGGLL
jgi:hypothetical protein